MCANETQQEKIFEVAEDKHELFNRIKDDYRGDERELLNAKTELIVTLDDGTQFDKGSAIIKNVGRGGALVTNIILEKQHFPLQAFSILLRILDGKYQDLEAECRPVRFSSEGGFGVGVKFDEIFVRV